MGSSTVAERNGFWSRSSANRGRSRNTRARTVPVRNWQRRCKRFQEETRAAVAAGADPLPETLRANKIQTSFSRIYSGLVFNLDCRGR
jgi:hypothetical protein